MAEPDPAVLLAQYRPVVQYDSLESYYADWAAVITDRPSNVLKRADGTVLAAAGPPTGNTAVLNLGSDYVSQAREMHAWPGFANKAHGRVVQQAGTTWLQYWFFMYYDDPGFLRLGTHEGDIEMIQLRLDPTGQPDAVTYAQHRRGLTATWDQVEVQHSSPVVYSARGTHASMLRAGDLVSDRSFLPDHNDAQGPRVRLDLVTLSEAQTPWAFWPGRWGGTRPEDQILGDVGIEASSPAAPNQHKAWIDPQGFHNDCEAADLPPVGAIHEAAAPKPAMPQLQVALDREANLVNVSFKIPTMPTAASPTRLVIGVKPSNVALPPATTVIRLKGDTGELQAPLPPDVNSVEIRATTHADDGSVSATSTVTATAAQS